MPDQIFTIGHSNHPIERFLDLLKIHNIDAVADTRSYPRSKFAPQYDSDALRQCLRENGIEYIFLGAELGGRPDSACYYDANGHVLYGRVAESSSFLSGLNRLREEMQKFRIAILCSEEDPSVCHRRLLIARVLRDRGAVILHIRANGAIHPEEDLLAAEAAEAARNPQLSLFEHSPDPEWKSILSVLPRRPQNNSSVS